MPEPFKNLFNKQLIAGLAMNLKRVMGAEFDAEGFTAAANANLHALELKARSRQITQTLATFLPADFPQACGFLVAILDADETAPLSTPVCYENGVRGWAVMPMADFVAEHGIEHFDLSMQALAHMTKRFTAEFAVRPLIIRELDRALQYLQLWALDDNFHLRRLASEGSRPRLPWAQQIPDLIRNPQPTLPVLEALRDDSSDYVRKSVANHLNDISKDHPALVLQLARQWLPEAPLARQKLLKHACRTLLKKGEPEALAAFGFLPAQDLAVQFSLALQRVKVGESLRLQCTITSSAEVEQMLMLDYIVHFRLASGKIGKKVFKWKTFAVPPGQTLTLATAHSFRPITTRTYYGGEHKIELQLNGVVVAEQAFEVHLPQ